MAKSRLALVCLLCAVCAPVVAIYTLHAAPGAPPAVAPPLITSFEGSLAEWQPGADVPPDPNSPDGKTAIYWDIAPIAAVGQRSAVLALDGRQGDGTIWLARPISVTATTEVTVTVEAQVWSAGEAPPAARVALYAGAQPPATEADFDVSQPANSHAGWRAFAADFAVTPTDRTVWVAVGIRAVGATQLVVPIDAVTVRVGGEVALGEDFEAVTRDMEGWARGADVPDDPNRPGRPVVWAIEPGAVRTGGQAAGFLGDGAGDDGLFWLTRPISVTGTAPVSVTVETHVWSAFESFNTLGRVALYAGPTPPDEEADFFQDERADDHAGWRPYRAEFRVTPQDGQVWVALGISIVWETLVWFPMDDARLCVDGRCHALYLPHLQRRPPR